MIFFEYKVRNGDTLPSVSSRLNMSAEELKQFHNSLCLKMHRVWFENLNGVERLIVPLNFKTGKKRELEKRKMLPSYSLSDSFLMPVYHVSETFEGSRENPLAIHYDVQFDIRTDQKSDPYILTFRQNNFKTGDYIPDNKTENLTLACIKSIMPVDFSIDPDGHITGPADHQHLVEKFKDQRAELEEFFTGERSELYFDVFQNSISDQTFFLEQFKSTLLFQTLFPEMDWFRKNSVWSENFFFLKNSFPVQCSMRTEHEDLDHDLLTTVLRGGITDACSLQELKKGVRSNKPVGDPVSGEIILQYITHKETKKLFSAEASLSLSQENSLLQKHTLKITQ